MQGPHKLVPGGIFDECTYMWDYDNDLDVDLVDYNMHQRIDPHRTANMPDSWLVLYNINSVASIEWKDWYLDQWGIPEENSLGLNVSLSEKILKEDFLNNIYYPVKNFLKNNFEIRKKIMGILVGFDVPGNFYLDSTHPQDSGGGGWSVSNHLQDLATTLHWPIRNPHIFAAYYQTPIQRLNKQTLGAHVYLTARIDAPSLEEAKSLTLRAKYIADYEGGLDDQYIYYDYIDPSSPAGSTWQTLEISINSDLFNNTDFYPLLEFESDNETTPNALMRFSYYRISGWNSVNWDEELSGLRVLGFAFNSWGATTVRSITDHGGRYVPNILFQGGFAAAIGATAEPYVSNSPIPATIIWCMFEGWTLGEAVFHSQSRKKWMWELVGDPFTTLPYSILD